MLVVTHLATPIAVATACEFSSCVTCAEKEDIVAAATCAQPNCTFQVREMLGVAV